MAMETQPFFKRILSGKKKYFVIGGAIILVLILIVIFNGSKKDTLKTVTVTFSSITQEVSVTGRVEASNSVNLAFEKSGKVAWITKEVGNSVSTGEIIISLDNGTEEAALENAEASLKSAEARYEELAKGSRPEDVQVSLSALEEARQDLVNDYGSVIDTINDAYNKTDNAVNVQTDSIFSNDQSQSPDLTFNVNNSQAKNEAIAGRVLMSGNLKSFKSLISSVISIDNTQEEKDSALNDTKNHLISAQNFLIKVSTILDASTNLSDSTLSTYKDSVATGRTNVNTALKAVGTLIETIASQKLAVQKANQELTLKKLGATPEVLAQAKASIDQAKANVKSAEATLRKTIVRSPIDGVVTKQDAKVGEIAVANNTLVSVMSAKSYKIEAYVPEADSTKLSVGDNSEATLDAYGNDIIFNAKVISIDPAEYMIDGVSTYKTTFIFLNEPMPIRSGMTANITVKTAEKPNVLVLPQRSVVSKNGKKYVTVVTTDGKNNEIEVQTGLKGSDGMIEIISGISEGNQVVNYVK